jgi:hypothetical protein
MLSSGIDRIHTGEVCIYNGLVWTSVYLPARQSTRSTNAAAFQARDLSHVHLSGVQFCVHVRSYQSSDFGDQRLSSNLGTTMSSV